MQKKGDIWISAVLYFGLGIIIISILLAAGLPVINKLRDKNIIIQSKQVIHALDQNIREVAREGPGSQRIVSVNLKKGVLLINDQEETITWNYPTSKILISELNVPVPEGTLRIMTGSTGQKATYNVNISANYTNIADLTRPGGRPNTFLGLTDFVIRNEGIVNKKITVILSEANG